MEVTQVLEDVRKRLSGLEESRNQLEQQRMAIEQHIADVEMAIAETEEDERVLRRVATQYNLPVATDGLLPREVQEWQQMPRTAAVERVLAEADRPLSPMGISQILHNNGRSDSAHNVSAALAHLKITNRARQADRGQWVHPRSEEPDLPEPASAAGGVQPTGMELIEQQLGGREVEELEGLRPE